MYTKYKRGHYRQIDGQIKLLKTKLINKCFSPSCKPNDKFKLTLNILMYDFILNICMFIWLDYDKK